MRQAMSTEHYVLCLGCGDKLRVCDCTRSQGEDHTALNGDECEDCDYEHSLEARVR